MAIYAEALIALLRKKENKSNSKGTEILPRLFLHAFDKDIQWNPDFSNLQGKGKMVRKIGEFEKSGVKLQYSTEETKRRLVRVIGKFEKVMVREIGIPLYRNFPFPWKFEKSGFHCILYIIQF